MEFDQYTILTNMYFISYNQVDFVNIKTKIVAHLALVLITMHNNINAIYMSY